MRTRRVGRRELQSCPAAADMVDGVIEINADVWGDYDNFQRRFILAHEEGHIVLDTDNEEEADRYAVNKVRGTARKSLKRSLETLYKVGVVNERRYLILYREALRIDWEQYGNGKAKRELESINQNNMKAKTGNGLINPYVQQKSARKKRAYRAFADGGEETENVKMVCQSKSHKVNGVKIGGYYFSFTNILLAAVLCHLVFWKK
jgi:hypothetical protein